MATDSVQSRAHKRLHGPYNPLASSHAESVDSGPFLHWWEEVEKQRASLSWYGTGAHTLPVSIEEMCLKFGTTPRRINSARETGRISISSLDKILVAFDGPPVWMLRMNAEKDIKYLAPMTDAHGRDLLEAAIEAVEELQERGE